MPNLAVLSLSDNRQVAEAIPAIAAWDGPVYFRLHRNEVPELPASPDPFVIGKAIRRRAGREVTLVATGYMVTPALEAAAQLEAEGVSAAVLEVHTIKPIDAAALARAAEETGAIVTAEEHNILGGLGSAVAEVLGEVRPCILERVGVKDTFAESGPYGALLEKYGLTAAEIAAAARRAVARKR
jgi:transketolase